MNDTISRIRLLKRLKHRRDAFCKNRIEFLGLSKNDKARVDEMDKCIAEVINAPIIEPEREKGKWIPCSERLPIDAGHYLCSFEKPNRIDHIHVDLAYWTGGRWYGYRADAICAWMPLPEPYREESEKHEGSD